MILGGVALKFTLLTDESLMTLVTKCGYSKPTKEDPIARRELFGYGEGSGEDVNPTVEVHRRTKEQVFVTLHAGDFAHLTPHLVMEAWSDLQNAGLV